MVNSRIKKNKRGWVRLLEAFIAIVLLTSVLVVVSKTNSSQEMNCRKESQ